MNNILIPKEIVRGINCEWTTIVTIVVDTQKLILRLGDFETPCSIGRSGPCNEDEKSEGDGCTPLGCYALRAVLFNPDRSLVPDAMQLPWRWTRTNDGWSDGKGDPCYNRPVFLPHEFSAETLRRDDPLYDIIVILGHNDDPPCDGNGSAIFFHLWNHEKPIVERTTEGCVAISRDTMMHILPLLSRNDVMEII